MTTTIKVDRLGEVMKRIKDLAKNEVLVGVPADEAGRYETNKQAKDARKARKAGEESPHQSTEGVNNAVIGYVNEFGQPEHNIPARPHLIPGVQEAEGTIVKRLLAGARKALEGDAKATDAALHSIGLAAQNAVRNKISNGPFAALADTTIADRESRGRTGQKPLIDTGQYRSSITYVIRPRGQKGS